jgi:hypothetical protein
MARDESPKALTDEIQKNGSLTYDLHLFSANQKSSLKVLTDSLQNARFIKIYCLCQNKNNFYGQIFSIIVNGLF